MQYNYFDIHSHLNFSKFDEDRETVIKQLQDEKIGTITIGTDLKTSKEAIELADTYENLYAAIGIHPADEPDQIFVEEGNDSYGALVNNQKVVAVGECGLDYAFLNPRSSSDKKYSDEEAQAEKTRQKDLFEQQIHFAVRYDKPLMIHCRDAYDDCIDILKSKQQSYGEKVRGNFHFFTSPIEIAKKCLDIGFTVSFTGPITFVPELAEVVEYVPLERMMSETDAPFAAPAPYRGKRNQPLYVKEIVAKIAEIKKIDLETVQQVMVGNALVFFKIKAL
jgi:TatD DNase family protein